MVLIQNYGLAIFFCVIACICWGSWANTQKIAVKTWRFELFYFDMVIGIVLVCALAAFTLGSFGSDGRSFMTDLETADFKSIGFAMIGGTLWNLGTLLFFSIGVLVSTFMFNPIFMAKPVEGEPVTMRMYFKGTMKEHLSGVLGGMIWCLGMVVSFMAVGAANPAIAYALSNAAPVVAMLWGIFVWKEFKDADPKTIKLLITMFSFYIIGLVLITFSNI